MSLELYIFMAVIGYLAALHEIMFRRTNWWLLGMTIIVFVMTVCSRLGYEYDYSDLSDYLHYFMEENDSYFEPGYVFVTDIIRFLFGDYPVLLITFVAIWVVSFVLLSAKLTTKRLEENSFREILFFPSCLIFVFILYWGCSFACEILRNGMAISLLFCSAVLAINNKYLWAFLICLSALLFHYTAVIFLLGLLFLVIVDKLEKQTYYCWFAILVIMDLFIGFFISFEIPVVNDLFNMIDELEMLSHYESYAGEDIDGSYFSTQYITYHLLGLLMLEGDLKDKSYNRAVLLFYVGLSLGTMFQTTRFVTRIQFPYLAMVVLVLYYYLVNHGRSFWEKQVVLCSYALIQSVMVLRYLGWHL